jgi:hypothetical protein
MGASRAGPSASQMRVCVIDLRLTFYAGSAALCCRPVLVAVRTGTGGGQAAALPVQQSVLGSIKAHTRSSSSRAVTRRASHPIRVGTITSSRGPISPPTTIPACRRAPTLDVKVCKACRSNPAELALISLKARLVSGLVAALADTVESSVGSVPGGAAHRARGRQDTAPGRRASARPDPLARRLPYR